MNNVKSRAPDYVKLRKILQDETGRKISLEEAQKLGQFLLRLTKNLSI